jgi:DMSO/TMAO reductase YedYZ molybdopterin-dependent catalytic subunit
MSDITDQIVDSRLKLRQRFLKRMQATPAVSDAAPLGAGPLNRHGMPQLPPDQTAAAPGKWPVLDLGHHPDIAPSRWKLELSGMVARPQVLDWDAMLRLEQADDVSDFHCVTGWSKLDIAWRGVRFSTVAAAAEPLEAARFVLCHGLDGYTTNLPLEEALKDDVLLVHTAEGRPLPREHGGPVRMITPQLWAWKGAKWICRVEFLPADVRGFWEERGYSNTAHPWRNDRYNHEP